MDLYSSLAPTASPTDILTSATLLGQIFVSWSPPPIEFQNGIINNYTITYRDTSTDMSTSQMIVTEQNVSTCT